MLERPIDHTPCRPMRPLGTTLIVGGAILGAAVAVAIAPGIHIVALPWIVGVGLAKLTLVSSAGLMAAGAVVNRLALRRGQRNALTDRGQD